MAQGILAAPIMAPLSCSLRCTSVHMAAIHQQAIPHLLKVQNSGGTKVRQAPHDGMMPLPS